MAQVLMNLNHFVNYPMEYKQMIHLVQTLIEEFPEFDNEMAIRIKKDFFGNRKRWNSRDSIALNIIDSIKPRKVGQTYSGTVY